jgi:hypothetical protein
LYTVYSIFAFHKPDDDHAVNLGDHIVPEQDVNISEDMRQILRSIREALNRASSGAVQSIDDAYFRIPKSQLQTSNELHTTGSLYGLISRATAAESLDSLLQIVTKVCDKMRNMIKNNSKQEHVESFLKMMGKITYDTKQVIYARLVRRIFMKLAGTNPNNQGDYPTQIEKCKWVVNALRGDQNP